MFGRGICEKYQLRDEKFPEPNWEEYLRKIPVERRKIS
jgi:hypothetical protein